jgi:Fe-S-cluster containining protein
MSVLMTSAEAVRLCEALRERPDFERLRATIAERAEMLRKALPAPPDEALNALLDLGSCVFLENRRCGIYHARPDGCRAALVWHDAWYCGRPEWDQCVPAELNQARVEQAMRLTLRELDAGRTPYWGQILPAVWLMLEHGDAYRTGADLSRRLDPAWVDSELIEFPSREQVLRDQAEHERIFREEPHPLGSPRGFECARREDLRPFRAD